MMWSAMNWLTQKAGINLDDAHEVLHGSDASLTQQPDGAGEDETNSDPSKENQHSTGNGLANSGKRMRRTARWSPPGSTSSNANCSSALHHNNSSMMYHSAGVNPNHPGGSSLGQMPSSPLTPIMVPAGGPNSGPYCLGGPGLSPSAQPSVPTIMVPTGVRPPMVVGYRGVPGLMPSSGSPMGSSKHSPSSMQWKDVSMASDINSPGFAFRIVRQAEKQADIGSKLYPTVQEKYLHTKHLPKVKLHGTRKPVMTPNKPKSAPLVQLPPSPKSSPALGPMLSNSPHSPSSIMFSQNSASLTDFRPTDFFNASMRSSADSHPVLSGLLDGTGSPVDHHLSCGGDNDGGVTTLSNTSITNMAVTAAITRSLADDDTRIAPADGLSDADPTSLKAVLAALNKSQSGKGVKRPRLVDYEDSGSKRPCSNEVVSPPDPSTNGHASSSSSCVGSGGEKRALDTSSCSSLDSSGQGSPCAKMPRTSPDAEHYNTGHRSPLVEALTADRPSPLDNDVFNGESESITNNVTSVVTPSEGLGGGNQDSETMSRPNKRRCVNPWEASLSSSRRMLKKAKTTNAAEFDWKSSETDLETGDKSSDDSDSSQNDSNLSQKEDKTKPTADEEKPEQKNDSTASDVPSDGSKELPKAAVAPHIVTLSAHRSDKQMSHTRLNRMLGMLFNLSEEEAASSTSVKSGTTATSSTLPTSSVASVATVVPVSVTSLPSQPAILATTSSIAPSIFTVSEAASIPNGTQSTSLAPTLLAPLTTTSVVVSSSAATTTVTSIPDSSVTTTVSELSRAVTLPVYSSASTESSSSVSASFTFKVPAKSPVASTASTVVSPTKNTQVIEGANSLLAFLNNKQSSPSSHENDGGKTLDKSKAPPAFSFGSKTATSNPLPSSFGSSQPSEPKKSESGFSLSAATAFTPTSSAISKTPEKTPSSLFSFVAPSATPSSAPSFGSVTSVTSVSSATATSAPAPSLFSFGASSAQAPTVAASDQGAAPNLNSSGFQFGMGAASGGNNTKDSSSGSATGGFTFGSSATNKTTSDPKPAISSIPSLLSFGSATSSDPKPLDGNVTASSGFSFSSSTAPVSTKSPAAASASSTFTFGSSNAPSSAFTFGKPAAPVSSSGPGPTANASPFSFGNASAPSSTSTDTQKSSGAAPSLFAFGGAANAATLPSAVTTTASSTSLFSFGKTTSAVSESNAASKPAGTSLFSFGGATTSAVSSGSGAPAATTAGAFGTSPFGDASFKAPGAPTASANSGTLQFGSNNSAASVFGAVAAKSSTPASENPPSFGAFGAASNLFGGAKNDEGNKKSSPGKTVTFGGVTSISNSGSNLFGQATTKTTSANLFGQTATPTFGSSTSTSNNDKTSTTSSTPAFQFGPSTTSSATASPFTFGNNNTTFGTTSSGVTPFGAAATTTTVAPTFGGTTSSSFGTSTSSATFTFGGAVTANAPTPAFGSTSNKSNPLAFGSSGSSGLPAFGASASNSAVAVPTFGAAGSGSAPSFGSTTSNPAPSFGGSSSSTIPSFGGSSAAALPSFGAPQSNSSLSFGSSTAAAPSFGSTATATPSFGGAGSSATPTFGSGAAATPSFGGSGSSFGTPSFGSPAPSQPGGMFQFAGTPATPQQQPPNAFSAGAYALGGQAMPLHGQEAHNLFSVGGSNAGSTSRRPRARAHRRNR